MGPPFLALLGVSFLLYLGGKWKSSSQQQGEALLFGINWGLHFCWKRWQAVKRSQVLTNWVLKNRQDLTYTEFKQKLDMAFWKMGWGWEVFS